MRTQNNQSHIEIIGIATAEQACEICRINNDFIHALIMEDVFEFEPASPNTWEFTPHQLFILKRAARLYRDLSINAPGIALVLELLAEGTQR